jgi:hypothetical protein
VGWLFVGGVVVSCGYGTGEPVADTADKGNDPLGIQTSDDGSTLRVAGVNARQERVAQVQVKAGRFVMAEEFAEGRVGDARSVDGRQVDIDVRGIRLHHESEGYGTLSLPLPQQREYVSLRAFLADPRVQQILQNRGVSFRDPAEAAFKEVCSHYEAHSLGPGMNCQQYSGNEPNGWDVNTCHSSGALSLGCSDISIKDDRYYSGFYTVLFECCRLRGGLVRPVEKTCVPQAGGESPCGQGGASGCAVCLPPGPLVTSCTTWCEGAGENCRHSNLDPGPDGASGCAKGARGPNRIAIVYQ